MIVEEDPRRKFDFGKSKEQFQIVFEIVKDFHKMPHSLLQNKYENYLNYF